MAKTKLQIPTAKEFIEMYKATDERTKAMILGMLIKATMDSPPPDSNGDEKAA